MAANRALAMSLGMSMLAEEVEATAGALRTEVVYERLGTSRLTWLELGQLVTGCEDETDNGDEIEVLVAGGGNDGSEMTTLFGLMPGHTISQMKPQRTPSPWSRGNLLCSEV